MWLVAGGTVLVQCSLHSTVTPSESLVSASGWTWLCSRTASWILRARVFIPSFLSPAGQKTTYGQGLEGPWERPPPLDGPQRDGSSEDQVEDPALNGETWEWGAEEAGLGSWASVSGSFCHLALPLDSIRVAGFSSVHSPLNGYISDILVTALESKTVLPRHSGEQTADVKSCEQKPFLFF